MSVHHLPIAHADDELIETNFVRWAYAKNPAFAATYVHARRVYLAALKRNPPPYADVTLQERLTCAAERELDLLSRRASGGAA